MESDKIDLDKKIQPSCLGAVSFRLPLLKTKL